MSIVLNGNKVEIPGIKTVSWVDPQAASMGVREVSHKSKRNTWIRGIVCHTIHGKLGHLLPGLGPNTDIDTVNARFQVNTDKQVSWDYTCDLNGEWLVQNDPLKNYTWQATSVNGYTCGFECVQLDNGDMYEGQIAKAVEFVDFLTAKLGIQRQIPWDMVHDCPPRGTVADIIDGGEDVIGVYNHSHQTSNRGYGDCGPWLPIALKQAGYETYAFNGDERAAWKGRQRALGFAADQCDGIAGPGTVVALKTAGKKHGMYVHRPIDDLI
jgi:hypothetical protein